MIFTTRIQAVLLGAIALIGSQAASALATQCMGCDATQMYNTARALGTGLVTVWNPANGEAHRFRTYCGHPNLVDPGSGNAKTSAQPKSAGPVTNAGCNPMTTEEESLPQEMIDVASALSVIWNYNGGSLSRAIGMTVPLNNVPFPGYYPNPPSAHDFLMDLAMQGQLRSLAGSPEVFAQGNLTSSAQGAFQYVLAHVDAMMSYTEGVRLVITFVFNDGSTVSYQSVYGDLPFYITGSAYDGSGHVLPDPNPQTNFYPGQWYYGPGQSADLAAFLAYMASLGIPITSGTGHASGIISCTFNPQTHETVCIQYQ